MKKKRWIRSVMLLLAVILLAFPSGKAEAAEGRQARALLILRGDYDGQNDLAPGPENDGINFRRILEQEYDTEDLTCVIREKEGVTTASGVKEQIQAAFQDSQDDDVNYFYYSGHGSPTGLALTHKTVMTAKQLADSFEGIRGINILVMDCCYSGGMASRSFPLVSGAEAFAESFTQAFGEAVEGSGVKARSALTTSRFHLLMASSSEELSFQMALGEPVKEGDPFADLGGFTSAMCYGCGVNPAKVLKDGYKLPVASADYDRNGEVSVSEVLKYVENTYHYAANHVRSYPAKDDACFVSTGTEMAPGISFQKMYLLTDQATSKKVAAAAFYSDKAAEIHYAIYKAPVDKLSGVTFQLLYTNGEAGEQFPVYKKEEEDEDKNIVKMRDGHLSVDNAYPNGGVLKIPLEASGGEDKDLTDGKYIFVMEVPGQDVRYVLPFALESAKEDSDLAKNFQVKLSGEYFDPEEEYYLDDSRYLRGVFRTAEGNEMVIRADFGTTNDPQEETPYLSCSIYSVTYDGTGKADIDSMKEVCTLGEHEPMQIIPTEYLPGTNILQSGECYREFYWDGKDESGKLVPEGTYLAIVTAEGAVSATEVATICTKAYILPERTAKITTLKLSRGMEESGDDAGEVSFRFPSEEAEGTMRIEYAVDTPGTYTLEIFQETVGAPELVRELKLAGEQHIDETRPMALGWDGELYYTLNEDNEPVHVYAKKGLYFLRMTLTPDDRTLAPVTAEAPFTVLDDKGEEPEVIPVQVTVSGDKLQADFAEGTESVKLLAFTVNETADYQIWLKDADGSTLAAWQVKGEQYRSYSCSWDGADGTSGTCYISIEMKKEGAAGWTTVVDQMPVEVTGLPEKKPTENPGGGDHTGNDKPGGNTGVTPAPQPSETFPERITLQVNGKTVKKLTVGAKEKVQLKAAIAPANADDQTVTYASSNPKVAAVSASGKVTAKKKGKAVITAVTANGKKASVTVTVKNTPKKITLSAKTKTLKKKKTWKAKVKFTGGAASYKITWTSNKKSVATVDKTGKIKALKPGRAVITAKTFNGKKAKVTIIVK